MGNIDERFVNWFRELRTKKFARIGRLFLKVGITANIMTTLSFLGGLISVYFLFDNYWLFFLFATIHFLADGLDGIIARVAGETMFGKYFDYFTDRLIEFLLILKVGFYLNDYYVFIALGLFVFAQSIHLYSKLEAPTFFTRSLVLLFLALQLPIVAYLITGAGALYSLARQLQWYLVRRS